MAVLTPADLAKSGSEHAHQRAFFCALQSMNKSVWECAYAIPNGRKRDIRDAGMLKAEGVKAGVPDVFIAWPFRKYAGLYLEFKKPGKGVVSGVQSEWHPRLVQRGYAVAVCYSWEEGVEVVKYYFDMIPRMASIGSRFIVWKESGTW